MFVLRWTCTAPTKQWMVVTVDEVRARSEYLKFLGLIAFFGLLVGGAAWLRPRLADLASRPRAATSVQISSSAAAVAPIPSPTVIAWLSWDLADPEPAAIEPAPSATPEPYPTPEPAVAAIPETRKTYIVRPGDTLSRIGRAYDVTVDQLAAANGISNPNRIAVGQVLIIPGVAPLPAAPAPLEVPVETYVVNPGDTLWGISRDLKVDLDALAAANRIADANRIRAGQVLAIPR